MLAVPLLCLLTAAPTNANHVGCGAVVTQDTTLDSDLTDCPGDGLVIAADGITLDLAGHTIAGGASRPEAGIDNGDGHARVTIENGHVQGFQNGVRLVRASDNHLQALSAAGNAVAINLDKSDQNRIDHNSLPANGILLQNSDDNDVVENDLAAISIQGSAARDLIVRNSVSAEPGGYGIFVRGSDHRVEGNSVVGAAREPFQYQNAGIYVEAANTRIRRNEVSDGDYGIMCAFSPGGHLIAENRLHDNVRAGIFDESCDATRIESNNSKRNGVGISVVVSKDVEVVRNRALDNRHGITFQEVANGRMELNVVADSREEGVDSYDGSGNVIARNRVARNRYVGISIADDGDRLEGNVVWANEIGGMRVIRDDNVVEENLIRDNGATGLVSLGARTRVVRNWISRSGGNGMLLIVSDGVIRNNLVSRSGEDRMNGGDGTGAVGLGEDGIYVLAYQDLAIGTVSQNRADRNADDGIDIEGPGALVSDNAANRNADLGIEAVPNTVDGGGNRARRNGNRLQCLNVSCAR
jgi:Right handed beta helix region